MELKCSFPEDLKVGIHEALRQQKGGESCTCGGSRGVCEWVGGHACECVCVWVSL